MASSLLTAITKHGSHFLTTQSEPSRQRLLAAATSLIHELETPGEKMARIGWGEPTQTAALRTAFELGLLKKLHDDEKRPMSSEQLAEGTKAEPLLVSRIMKHLASSSIVKETARDQYIATPFSVAATTDPAITSGLTYSFEIMSPIFQALPEFLAKTGYKSPSDDAHSPFQYGLKTKKPFFAYMEDNKRLADAFNNFLIGYAKVSPRWFEYYPVEERLFGGEPKGPFLVDVGGGLGHETIRLAAQYPNLPGALILQDQPSVIAKAQASPSFPSTIKAVAHDFFQPQPSEFRGARVYFLRLILHDWTDEKSAAILSHIRDAMVPGHSRLLINETVMKDTGAPWQQTSLDWQMMSVVASRERTETQWRELLKASGLEIRGIWRKDTESVIEAVLEGDSKAERNVRESRL